MTSPSSFSPAGAASAFGARGHNGAIALPARFADAAAAGNDAPLDGGANGSDNEACGLVELLEFRSLEHRHGSYAPPRAEGAAAPDLAATLADEIAALEGRLRWQEENSRRKIDEARSEGRSEGQRSVEQERDRAVAAAREQVARLAERFRAEHEQYFRHAEREVVRLALAIAARVLHREAAMDPLLLSGAVRVALEKLADTTGLLLRTSPGEVLAWQEMFRLTGEARVNPEVVGDMALSPGDCVLETRLGTVELGVRAQLEEIEKGFFDLLNQKPKRPGLSDSATASRRNAASIRSASGHDSSFDADLAPEGGPR